MSRIRSADGSNKYSVASPVASEAETLTEDIAPLALLDSPPVLMTSEPDPDLPDEWRMDAYFETEPGPADLVLLRSLVPSAASVTPAVEALEEQDWVTLSQAGLEPIRAGRFFVHTPVHAPDPEAINFEIDAGLAFGTGQHVTTAGCLAALDRL